MKVNKGYLPELKFKDLFFHVLYRWRSILLIALAAALVLGGLQYMSAKKAQDAEPAPDPELSGLLKYRQEVLESQKVYIEESPYIRLDANSVWNAEKVWLVKSADESVSVDSILQAYGAPLAGVSDEELTDAFGTAAYAGELVRVTLSGDSDTVSVRVLAADRETAEKGLAFITGKIEGIAAGSAQEIGAHELTVISEDVAARPDEELAEKQWTLLDQMTDSEKLVNEGLDKLAGQRAAPAPAALQSAVKKAVLAFVLVFVLMCGLYVVLYAVNGKMKGSEEMTGKYGVPVLGEFFRSGARKSGKGIDGLLEKLEGKNRVPGKDAVCDRTAALADGWEGAKIALVSVLPEAEVKPLQEELAKRLPEKEIRIVADFVNNGKAVSEAAEADAVIWAEEKGVSKRAAVEQTAETLIAAGVDVKGIVLV